MSGQLAYMVRGSDMISTYARIVLTNFEIILNYVFKGIQDCLYLVRLYFTEINLGNELYSLEIFVPKYIYDMN